MKKYLIRPGFVISENDGDKHYVGAEKLMRLYKVRPDECVVDLSHEYEADGLIVLGVRVHGDYHWISERRPGQLADELGQHIARGVADTHQEEA